MLLTWTEFLLKGFQFILLVSGAETQRKHISEASYLDQRLEKEDDKRREEVEGQKERISGKEVRGRRTMGRKRREKDRGQREGGKKKRRKED